MYRILQLGRVTSLALVVLGGMTAVGLCQNTTQEVARWTQGPADAVFTAAGHSYFGSGTLLIVGDASDINAPRVVGFVDLGMLIGDIVVIGDVAHIAAGNFTEEPGPTSRWTFRTRRLPSLFAPFQPRPQRAAFGSPKPAHSWEWRISWMKGPVPCWCSICGPLAIPQC